MPNRTKIEKLLLEAARQFNSTLEYEQLIENVLRLVAKAVNCEVALVFRVDHKRTNMRIRCINCLNNEQMRIVEHELGRGVIGWVTQYREPVILDNAHEDDRFDNEFWSKFDINVKTIISVPLVGKGQMIGVIEAVNKLDGSSFNEVDLDILTGLANQIAVAIDNANLYRQAKREAIEKNLLFEIGKNLSSSHSLNEVLCEMMSSLKKAVDFDAGGVFLINSDKEEIDSLYTVGYEGVSQADLHLKFGQGLVGHVAQTGDPIIVSDVSEDEHYINVLKDTKSELVVPLKMDNRLIGVINLESSKSNVYNEEILSLMGAFGTQAAITIERAQFHERDVAANKIDQQLKIARDIQTSFLPNKAPKLPGYDISGENIPSGEVGGDYYDFINIVENQIGIAIGDVSGKGIPAALLMASFRASLIAEIRNNYSIRTICQKVNKLLYESMKPGNFVTAVYGVLDAKNHIMTFSNCGHNLPMLLRADKSVEYLREGGPILGVTPEAEYEERPIYIGVNDIVLLFTDGVVEVFNDKEEQFGEDRLRDLVIANRDRTTTEIRDEIYYKVKKFASKDYIFDDFTMIVLKRLK